MKRVVAFIAIILGAFVFASVMITGWSVGRGAGVAEARSGQPAALAAGTTLPPHLYLSIETPGMLGGTEETGPAYVPSAFTLPANTDVIVTVTNFDGATALPAASVQFAKASGVKGSVTTQVLDAVHPNATAATRSGMALDPKTGVAHTFTIAKLGFNVPIAPLSRTTFTFHTGAAGVYQWRCMDPCGSGSAGWGAAMNADGFMQGKVTFA